MRIGRVNEVYRLIFLVGNAVLRGPDVIVPDGCTVYVRAHNGTKAGNTDPVFVSPNAEAVTGPDLATVATYNNQTIAPNTQVGFPCENLNEIHAVGTAADGIVISVLG